MKYYPVFLNLQSKKAVIIGGGNIAERKVLTLLKSGASVTVVSPELTDKLHKLAQNKIIKHISRRYRKNDLKEAFLAVAATDSSDINARVSGDARGLVNVVDVPSLCNFIAPSVITRGALTIAISTSGVSPALAKTIRKELEKQYGSEIGQYLSFLAGIRKKALTKITDRKVREKFLKDLASAKILRELRTKGLPVVKKGVLSRLASLEE